MTITVEHRDELAAAIRTLRPGYISIYAKCDDNGCVVIAEYEDEDAVL